MKWALIALAVVVGVVVLAVLIGLVLPKGHVASRTVRLKAGPEAVWALMIDFAGTPRWNRAVTKVERVGDRNGHEVWNETRRDGWGMPLETVEAVAHEKLVRRIADPKLPFGGTWMYEIRPADGGSAVTITERGEVKNPIFRLMSRMMDRRATMDAYLRALAKELGEEARFEA